MIIIKILMVTKIKQRFINSVIRVLDCPPFQVSHNKTFKNTHINLLGEHIGDDCGERGEKGSQKDTNISDIDGDIQEPHKSVKGGRGYHQPRINSASNNPAQRIPRPIIEPVVEVVEALLGQEPRGTVVEVRVKLMDHTLESQHGEQTGNKGWKLRKKNTSNQNYNLTPNLAGFVYQHWQLLTQYRRYR